MKDQSIKLTNQLQHHNTSTSQYFNCKAFKLLIIVMMLATVKMEAQFTGSTIFKDTAATVNANTARYTGNDALQNGSDIYRVSCWDNGSSAIGMAWRVHYSASDYTGKLAFTSSSSTSPSDICLIEYHGGIYAVATYHQSGSYFWEVFQWNTATKIFNSISNAVFATGSYGYTLHIDADENGNFAIVWDDSGPRMFVETGNPSGLNNSGTAVQLSGDNIKPDVAVFWNGSYEIVNITCIEQGSGGTLFVDKYTFSGLASGSASSYQNVDFHIPASGYSYDYPRIACPNSSGDYRDWTVVVQEVDAPNALWYIVGFNDNAGTVSSAIIYNDGTSGNSPFPTLTYQNSFPVVTYDDNYPSDGIWVGWTLDWTGGAAGGTGQPTAAAVLPIVLKCDNVGMSVPVSGTTTYWEVPDAASLVTADSVAFLSLSGRHAKDYLFLTYNVNVLYNTPVHDIYTKGLWGASSATSLRTANTLSGSLQNIVSESMINSDVECNFKLYNLKGELVFETTGNYVEILAYLKYNDFKLPSSLYLSQIHSIDGLINRSAKVFIGN